jgi:hypothetical protein
VRFVRGETQGNACPIGLDGADSIGSAMEIGEAVADVFWVSSGRDCCCVLCSDGPTCLRMAFSVTPIRRATSRLLIPSARRRSMIRSRLVGTRRRPERHPERVARADIPPF